MKIVLLLFALISFESNSQHNFRPEKRVRDRLALLIPKDYSFNEGERLVIEKCNTAKHSFYHTDTEKEFILLMNLARTNPAFLCSFITHRYDSSLWKQLPPITFDSLTPILKTSFGLHLSALIHAKKSGKKGTIGHQNIERRIKLFNFYFRRGTYGENCHYGSSEHPLVHFISLMNSKRHYCNIMETDFNVVGVSFRDHIRFGKNSVTCFGWK